MVVLDALTCLYLGVHYLSDVLADFVPYGCPHLLAPPLCRKLTLHGVSQRFKVRNSVNHNYPY
jgi:membrane-associated phospholipid phosphatase